MKRAPDGGRGVAASLLQAAGLLVRSDPGRALRGACAAARASRGAADPIGVTTARDVAGRALLFLSRPLAAARVLRRVARWHAASPAGGDVRDPLLSVAQALLHADHLVAAEAVLSDVAGATPRSDESQIARRLHLTRAALEFRREQPRAALRHYRSYRRLPRLGQRIDAIADTNAANSLAAAGRPSAARRRFALARTQFVAAGTPELCSHVDQNEAYARLRDGDLGDALALFDRALDAAERATDLALFPALCLDRAELFLQLAMPAEARREIQRLRKRVPRLTDLDESHAAFVSAFAALLRGSHANAAGGLADVAGDYLQLGFRERAAHCRILEARARLEAGSIDDAEELVTDALRALTRKRDPRRISAELLATEIACRQGDIYDARRRIAALRAEGDDGLPPWTQVEIARTDAHVAQAVGDARGRRTALLRAADALDAQMGRLPVDEYLIPFLGAQSWLYQALAADLLADGRHEEALEAIERGRARALLELLGAPMRLQTSLTERRVARRRRELGVAQLRLHEAATRPDGINPEQLTHRRRQLEQQARRTPSRRGAAVRPWSGVRRALPDGTSLLEYAWIDDRLHAFVARREGVVHRVLDVDRATTQRIVQRLAFQFRTARTRPDAAICEATSHRALEVHLGRARDALWAPLASDIPPGDLVIVPAEHLHLVPFHAIAGVPGDEQSDLTISYAPSATTFVTPPSSSRATGARCSVFALADDAAPAIADEAQAIAEIWPETEILAGADAEVSAFRDRVADSRVVHVATHGVFEETAPLFSSLRLADGWVNAYDVYGMRIGAELVVLAACESARSVASRDADLLGLVRAFLVAGAGNVLAPQWPISDVAAKTYVIACFSALHAGAPTAEAARRAAIVTRERHPHPADWAGWFPFCRVPPGLAVPPSSVPGR